MEERHFMRYNLLLSIVPISFGTTCFIKFSQYLCFLREDIPQHHLKIYSKIKFLLDISPLFTDYLQKERIIPISCFFLLEQKLKPRNFSLDIRRNFFTVWVTMQQNRFLREVVELPLMEGSRSIWTQSCSMCSIMTLLERGGWTR